jgi:hypothetical protein
MHVQIFLWDGMCASDNFYAIASLEKTYERVDVGTGRVTNQQSGCQVNNLRPVLHHFLAGVFDVAAWATSAGSVAYQFDLLSFIA